MAFAGRKDNYERFCLIVEAMERKEHHSPAGMARIVEQAYELNQCGKAKERKRPLKEMTDRILRDYTPESENASEKI